MTGWVRKGPSLLCVSVLLGGLVLPCCSDHDNGTALFDSHVTTVSQPGLWNLTIMLKSMMDCSPTPVLAASNLSRLGRSIKISLYIPTLRYHKPINQDNGSIASLFVAIGDHRLNAMDIRAETPHLDLLALARLNSQGVRVNPLPSRYICRLGGICQNVEDCRLVDDGQVCHHRNNLLENRPDF
jgi:hypothetical protein